MVNLRWDEPDLSHRTHGKGTFTIVCDEHGVIPYQKHSGPYQAWKRHVAEHSQPEKVAIGNAMAKSQRQGYPIFPVNSSRVADPPPW